MGASFETIFSKTNIDLLLENTHPRESAFGSSVHFFCLFSGYFLRLATVCLALLGRIIRYLLLITLCERSTKRYAPHLLPLPTSFRISFSVSLRIFLCERTPQRTYIGLISISMASLAGIISIKYSMKRKVHLPCCFCCCCWLWTGVLRSARQKKQRACVCASHW